MPSKKRPDKLIRLKDLYDLSKPEDLFTILPQEMELAEVKGMAYEQSGAKKKDSVIKFLLQLAEANDVELNEEILSVFVDIIVAASKGKYALNKDQP